jgi:hypothetical protein
MMGNANTKECMGEELMATKHCNGPALGPQGLILDAVVPLLPLVCAEDNEPHSYSSADQSPQMKSDNMFIHSCTRNPFADAPDKDEKHGSSFTPIDLETALAS